MVKNPPAMQEIQVQSRGREDLLEKGMATHSSILAWTISWTEEPGGLQFMRSQRCGHDSATNFYFQSRSEVCTLENRVSGPVRTGETQVEQNFQKAGKEETRVAEFLCRLQSRFD